VLLSAELQGECSITRSVGSVGCGRFEASEELLRAPFVLFRVFAV
jgi:hypothetical protein